MSVNIVLVLSSDKSNSRLFWDAVCSFRLFWPTCLKFISQRWSAIYALCNIAIDGDQTCTQIILIMPAVIRECIEQHHVS